MYDRSSELPPNAPGLSRAPGARRRRSPRGAWTIVAIFLLGSAVYLGLWLSPRSAPAPVPPGTTPGVPARPLCLLVCDLRGRQHTVESLLADLRDLRPPPPRPPDLAFLVGVAADEATDLAAGFGMAASYEPELFQHIGLPRSGGAGVLLMARVGLYSAAPLRADGATFGVRAVAVADGRRFQVACVEMDRPADGAALLRWARTVASAEPILVGGALADAPRWAPTTRPGFPLKPAGAGLPVWISPAWSTLDAGSPSNPKGAAVSWIVLSGPRE